MARPGELVRPNPGDAWLLLVHLRCGLDGLRGAWRWHQRGDPTAGAGADHSHLHVDEVLTSREVAAKERPPPATRTVGVEIEVGDPQADPIAHREAAGEDRAAILDIVATLPKADRALIPDVVPAVNALVERVANLAQMYDRLNQSFDQRLVTDLDARIAEAQAIAQTPEGQHRLSLLQRQRATAESLVQRRTALSRQIDNAGLALGNLRLDLIKLRSSGLQSALSDVTSATQEARVLSRDIDAALDAAAEVKNL